MLDKLCAADFLPLLNEIFLIYFDLSSPSTVHLIEINEKKSAAANNGRQPFSVVFRGPKDTIWPQGMYKIEHKKLGDMQLFLVPIGPDEDGLCYEAVFN